MTASDREDLWRGAAFLLRWAASLGSAALITLLLFLVLPILQQVGQPPMNTSDLGGSTIVELPPPPPPEEEPEEEEPEEEEPPEMEEEVPPMDLEQLSLALNPGAGGLGEFGVGLSSLVKQATKEAGAALSEGELDQKPRPVFRAGPTYPSDLKRQGIQGTVFVLALVDERGRVQQAKAVRSAHPGLSGPAEKAAMKWKFEPGRRKGRPVPSKVEIPFTFQL